MYLLPLQLLEFLDQLALQGRKASRALLAPLAHQVPLAPQEERPTSAGGGQCAQVLLEQGWSIMALLQALTSQSEEEDICAATGADVQYQTEATTANSNDSVLHGTEYVTLGRALSHLHNHNAPCAVCEVTSRSKQIMIPGRLTCPDTWTTEYSGWLMTERNDHYRSTFICLDKTPEAVPGAIGDTNGAVMLHVEADCSTGLSCSDYDETKELSCVVCTK